MFTHDFTLRLKSVDDAGTFRGLASPYGGPPDYAGDVIEPGAFKQSIAQQGSGYPLLWSHKSDEPIGLAKVSDSPAGLVVDGSLLMDDPAAKRAYTHLKAGTVKGLSIGYSLPYGEGKIAYGDDGTRTLKEIRLHEISIVPIPAASRAQVVSVKSLADVESVLRAIKDPDADVVRQLRGISRELKRLLAKDALCECDCPECLAGDCADCSNEECEDPNCEGSVNAEELAALKQLAISLKSLTQ